MDIAIMGTTRTRWSQGKYRRDETTSKLYKERERGGEVESARIRFNMAVTLDYSIYGINCAVECN